MFGIWNDDDLEILNYWYVLLDNFETPATEFYDAIEHDLATRELTGLEISRIEYSEGGIISAQRQYLRLRRERIVFDICAAPYGTAWFFSCRFARYQVAVYVWEILILLVTLAAVIWFYASLFGLDSRHSPFPRLAIFLASTHAEHSRVGAPGCRRRSRGDSRNRRDV